MNIDFCCPVCKHELVSTDEPALSCAHCHRSFPVHNGIPVLINEEDSVFSINEIISSHAPQQKIKGGFKNILLRALLWLQKRAPGISLNLKAKKNYALLAGILLKEARHPKVLVIGGRVIGEGMEAIIKQPIEFIETDIAFGPRTKIICDAHHLPFKDNYFDAVIIQAVLEYVLSPEQCVAEVHRVLKDNMPVYAETPFMQQVHGREYDFTRFSYLGQRRLFRNFEEIDAGACVGTGSALAWAYKYFLLSFTNRKIIHEFLLIFSNYTSFFFKYFDRLTINKSATLDAASGYYFLGRKSRTILSDKELIKQYKGVF